METSQPHAVVLSSPGLGHLIPILELGKRLATHLNFNITIFVVSSHASPAESNVLQSFTTPKCCEIIELPPVDISNLIAPHSAVVTQIAVMMREITSTFRSAISGLKSRPDVLIVDLFGTESLIIADELTIPKYVYIATNAWFLALTLYVPCLDKMVEGEYVDLTEPVKIPGCNPVRPEDLVDPMMSRTDQQYGEYVRIGLEIPMGDGILINTWENLESKTLSALRNEEFLGRFAKVPVYPIGPLARPGTSGLKNELRIWLDNQPAESVIYVSFGSGGTMSAQQITELAHGLEMSRDPFIWVVRPPVEKDASGCFFTAGKEKGDVSGYLPDGFLTRTEKTGIVVPMWAPQVEILSHPSVGGFISHGGWNSTLESITNGVPMLVWPLYSEQRMNAEMLTAEIGVGVRPAVLPTEKVVERAEIATMVREIMERDEIRVTVKELKESGTRALGEGGSSYCSLSMWWEKAAGIGLERRNLVADQCS